MPERKPSQLQSGIILPSRFKPAGSSARQLSGSPQDHGGAWWSIRVWLLVLSTFFPYAGLAVGANTHVPLSALAALLIIHSALRIPGVLVAFILAVCGPVILAFLLSTSGFQAPNQVALIIWPFHILPLFGFAGILIRGSNQLISALRWSIAISVAYSLVQKIFLEMGTIPFLQYYDLPGYASVSQNAEVITTYVKRPFGFFPEPSFLAGTLALAAVALILLRRRASDSLKKIDVLLAVGCVGAIYLSDSGSGLISIGLILFVLLWPAAKGAWRLALVLGVTLVTLWLGSSVLESRGLAQNYSWSDRSASILGALRYFVSSNERLLLGTGKGSGSMLFRQGSIPLDGLQYFTALPDVFSVIARLWLECGLLFGVSLTLACVGVLFRAVRLTAGVPAALACVALWLLVSGLTISYDSAAWIWGFPGICLGIIIRNAGDPAVPLSVLDRNHGVNKFEGSARS